MRVLSFIVILSFLALQKGVPVVDITDLLSAFTLLVLAVMGPRS